MARVHPSAARVERTFVVGGAHMAGRSRHGVKWAVGFTHHGGSLTQPASALDRELAIEQAHVDLVYAQLDKATASA